LLRSTAWCTICGYFSWLGRKHFVAGDEENCLDQGAWLLTDERLQRVLDTMPMPQCA
jgi:hypothetical protein